MDIHHVLADMRVNYTQGILVENEAPNEPYSLFDVWLKDAKQRDPSSEPNAVCLATCVDNRPSNRIVLLKHFDKNGFVFFTNYNSRKGKELTRNPFAAMTFWWGQRQVRVEGSVEKIDDSENDEYFFSRPKGSQIGAWASPQSSVLPSRQVLDDNEKHFTEKFQAEELKRPSYWGGFRLKPDKIEFWQGRPSRLHDRLLYTLIDSRWERVRLAP
ncbi:hypothetical protein HDV06_003824 [Boothiomyces sp. JEL0866]|nr:hypothetical protein HDV06_003824 [Boothiomyces sp. JEL0866]